QASLRFELCTALRAAALSGKNAIAKDVRVENNGSSHRLRLTVRPLAGIEQDGLFAVILQELTGSDTVESIRPSSTGAEALSADLDAMTRLHKLATLFVRERSLESVLEEIVDAAIAISGAAFGNIQLIDATTSELKIVAQRGFPEWWLAFWNHVPK